LLAGLLAVDPHRLYLYWDVSGLDGLTLTLVGGGGGWEKPRAVEPTGGLYMTGLDPDCSYQAQFLQDGEVVLQSNAILLPPDREHSESDLPDAIAGSMEEDLPSSASLVP
jgi:hypothetical protein